MDEPQTLQELDATECRRLLQSHDVRVGRAGIVDDDGRPVVLPLNFQLHHDVLVLRTGDGELLRAVQAGRPLAFEVDTVDPAWREGWSVLVRGVPEEVTDPDRIAELRQLGVSVWAPGPRDRWVLLPLEDISGRRLV